MIKGFYVLVFFLISQTLRSQTISGNIRDEKESLIGATIVCDGNGVTTDVLGNYKINLNSGSKSIQVRYFGYKNIDIQVTLTKDTVINFLMSSLSQELETITILAKTNKESLNDLVNLQSKSANVIDGISAESFKKTPDSKASDVLRRISGATIQEGKFLVIRGLNDRYNFALINGCPLPSSESDKRAFSFDILPTNMIDAITIHKTSSPDLPGEFSGGVITIRTTEPKDTNYISLSLTTGYNTITTFNKFQNSESNNLDLIGLGLSSRELPKDLPSTKEYSNLSKQERANLASKMNWTWSTMPSTSLPNTNIQFSLSRNKKLKSGNIGIYTGFYWSKNESLNLNERRDFEEQDIVVKKMELLDSVFTKSIFANAIFNITYDIDEKNTIKSKNLLSINSEDRINSRIGVREWDNDPRQWERSTNFWYQQNILISSQLTGQHEIGSLKLNWYGNYNLTQRDIPNLRRIVYRKYSMLEDDTTEQYSAVIQSNGTIPTAAGNMFWSNCKEDLYSFNFDIEKKIVIGKIENNFKVGTFHQSRTRDFWSRNFGFSQYKPTGSQFNSQILLLPSNQIFQQSNLGLLSDGKGGFKLDESTNVDDNYTAYSILHSAFIMTDSKFNKIRAIAGIRVESYNQVFKWIEFGSNLDKKVDSLVLDVLPSINLLYSLTDKIKIRVSYSKTVSRPEFRELAPFSFYNFINDNIVSGDPSLKRCQIQNLDFRFEYFAKASQMITISFFQKHFTNPIEIINRTGTSGAAELYLSNVNSANSFGSELEIRKNLLKNLTVYTNMAYIYSQVDMIDVLGSISRPLQGQSPYIFNTGVFWSWKNFGFNCSWNYIGPRIFIVGNVQEPSVWERGRHLLDLQLSKKFKRGLEIKINVKDALAQKSIYFQDLDGNKKWSPGIDNNWQQTIYGSWVNLSVKYQF